MSVRGTCLVRSRLMSFRGQTISWRGRRYNASGPSRKVTTRGRLALRATLILALLVATLALSTTPAVAATKSPRELVPAGAHVLYWSSPSFNASGTIDGTITVKSQVIVNQVRALINALPLSDTLHRACPDDMMQPQTVSFAASASSTPFTKVVFQLGGCPSAEVFQHGKVVLPTLGGPNLSSTYAKIKHLIDPSAEPLA
jgi:hypothetical protein